LPHVAVGVDEARNDEPTLGPDHFGAWSGRLESRSDLDNHPVTNEDVTVGLVPERRIHGDDMATFDEEFVGHGASPTFLCLLRGNDYGFGSTTPVSSAQLSSSLP
jgi:hypothetical protein